MSKDKKPKRKYTNRLPIDEATGKPIKTDKQKAKQNGPRFNELAREALKAEIGKLNRRGYSANAIAEMMGISVPMVSHYIKQIKQSYIEVQLLSAREMIVEKLEQYRDIRAIAWEAYDRSCEDTEKQVEEFAPPLKLKGQVEKAGKKPVEAPGSPGDATESLRRLKVIMTKQGRLPANEFLLTILSTLEAERKLLGLDAAQKLDLSGTMATASVDLADIIRGIDPFVEIVNRPAIADDEENQ